MSAHQATGNKQPMGGGASHNQSTDWGAVDSETGASLTVCETWMSLWAPVCFLIWKMRGPSDL